MTEDTTSSASVSLLPSPHRGRQKGAEPVNKHVLTPYAQKLRREMTKEERHLWYDFLAALPIRFRRQKVLGRYIVDFYCADARLVIELDGGQHYEDAAQRRDAVRDLWMKRQGLTVLRYSNADIEENFEGVCADIIRYISR